MFVKKNVVLSGSENANGCIESCSEQRGEYHACLTREISLYPL